VRIPHPRLATHFLVTHALKVLVALCQLLFLKEVLKTMLMSLELRILFWPGQKHEMIEPTFDHGTRTFLEPLFLLYSRSNVAPRRNLQAPTLHGRTGRATHHALVRFSQLGVLRWPHPSTPTTRIPYPESQEAPRKIPVFSLTHTTSYYGFFLRVGLQ
jgi:hypothetical protein